MFRRIIIILFLPLTSLALVQESGTLTGFLMDTCATCAYDNWQSHVSERIVRPGFNDYGPASLDPQTNGFGGFEYIPVGANGDSTLARWRQVFEFAFLNQWTSVDSMLALYSDQWSYELVHFTDLDNAREYYILREWLDYGLVDVNGDTLPDNDVVGGFRKGWGVFIFNEQPRHATTVLQLPHPEDDFMSIPVGIQMFQETEMAILMIAGAGREVMWDSSFSQYNNSRSISDPSRNARHPFAVLSKVATDEWSAPPINPLVIIQLHSYDHGSHLPLPAIQVSCYADDDRPNPPVRDVVYHRDLFHALPFYPVNGIAGDTAIVNALNNYIGLWCSPQYTYYGEDTAVTIRSFNDLIGANNNVEAEYCHVGHSVSYHTENFIHIELDEYPDELWTPLDWPRWLPGTPPTEWSTYVNAQEYFAPLIAAIDSALTWHEIPDTLAPDSCAITQATDLANGTVMLTWSPAVIDRYFDSYEIYYDTIEVTLASPHVSRAINGYTALGDPSTTTIGLGGLVTPVWQYQFAIRAIDLASNEAPLSPAIGITDGLIYDLSIFMGEDSLYLNWSAQPNDSLFEVREYPTGVNGFYLLGLVDSSTFAFTPTDISNDNVCVIVVKRILR